MNQDFRCGVVAIAGRPNVGKSTFLNRVLGTKLAIVTPKPQTTRDRILGILTRPGFQILFTDTPGIHDAVKPLNRKMVAEADSALADADVALVVTDAHNPNKALELDKIILQRLEATRVPAILAINKIDRIDKPSLLPLIAKYAETGLFRDIIPISALDGDGVDALVTMLEPFIPEGPPMYPEDDLSDRSLRFFATEIVREKVTLLTRKEVPYSTAVTVDEFLEPEPPATVRISLTIHVERDSQKRIVIGKGGSMLTQIGVDARRDLEELIGRKVMLKLFVRVTDDWAATSDGLKKVVDD